MSLKAAQVSTDEAESKHPAGSPESSHDNPINFKLAIGILVAVLLGVVIYGLVRSPQALPEGIADPVISGESLVEFSGQLGDAAVGQPMPLVTGSNFTGGAVELGPTGNAQMLVFLAHWCSICRDEVPTVQQWLDGGNLPAGIELRSIATAIEPGRDNFPPDVWLEREGWSPDVLADTTSDVARAYGLSAFPFWVFVGPDGKVVARAQGALPVEQLDAIAAALLG